MLVHQRVNWSVFQAGAKLYVTAIACLAYGLAQYNEMVRCTVAHSGNDHRLGAQETGMEGGWGWEWEWPSLTIMNHQSTLMVNDG